MKMVSKKEHAKGHNKNGNRVVCYESRINLKYYNPPLVPFDNTMIRAIRGVWDGAHGIL